MQEALMKDLARRGHQVDVVTHFPLEKPIPNYKNISLKGSLPQVMNNLTAQEIQTFGTLSWSLATLVENNGNYLQSIESSKDTRVDQESTRSPL